jgi:aspartokinase-like uncharacterized kinase
MEVRMGIVVGDTMIVNGRKPETVLSGLRTNTFTGTTVARDVAATLAVTTVLDTNAVGSAVPFQMI